MTVGSGMAGGYAQRHALTRRASFAAVRLVLPASLAIAALSLLLPSAPTTDPWGWIVWGREAMALALDTDAGGTPSWKPGPLLVTAPASLFGDAAPLIWLALARAAGPVAAFLAYRLAARLGGGRAGGGAAAVAVVALQDFPYALAHGFAEPLVIALVLGAVLRALDGHGGQALALGGLAGLVRPELWPAIGAWGLWLGWREPARRPLVAAVGVALPALWLGGDWLGSGSPFHGRDVARVNFQAGGEHPGRTVLRDGLRLAVAPVWPLALAALWTAWRRRERATLVLGAGVVGSALFLAAATAAGYPGSGRFLIAPAAVACLLAGVGAARIARRLSPVAAAVALRRPGVPLAAGWLVLAAVSAPFLLARADAAARDLAGSVERARLQGELRDAVARAGGARAVLACGRPALPTRLNWSVGALAWELDAPLNAVERLPARPRATVLGAAPALPLLRALPPAQRGVLVAPPPGGGTRVLFAPYRGGRIEPDRPLGGAPRTLAVSGDWEVVALGPCGR